MRSGDYNTAGSFYAGLNLFVFDELNRPLLISISEPEVVQVSNGFFARLIAFFKMLFGSLPVYIDNVKQ